MATKGNKIKCHEVILLVPSVFIIAKSEQRMKDGKKRYTDNNYELGYDSIFVSKIILSK